MAQCAEMCLHGYVAKTLTGVTKKHCGLDTKCVVRKCCGKDTFTGVTKMHCGLGAYKMHHSPVCGNVSSWLCGKDTFY